MSNPFSMQRQIYYHDTDAGGVVYYAAYLKFFEEARGEFFRARGVDIVAFERQGVLFPAVKLDVRYKKPALYGDEVAVTVTPERVGQFSFRFAYEVKRDDEVLVEAKLLWGCVNPDLKPQKMPNELREVLKT